MRKLEGLQPVSKEMLVDMIKLGFLKNGKKGADKTWTILSKGKNAKRKNRLVPPDVFNRYVDFKNKK